MNERNFKKVPAQAFTCASGSVELGVSSGDKSKTSPVRLKARSGQAIDHPYWGKIAHDFSGMRLHKNRLPIDYVHNSSEVLGYVNKFDSASGDLFASGALIPFKGDDRASEVIHKMREGVPYEASIFFGGDGIVIEEVAEGESAEVNGYALSGPAVIVREWPLRGIAVCPYGADMNTDSAVNFAGSKEFTVTILERNQNEETKMAETQVEAVEVASPPAVEPAVQETPDQAVEAETPEAVEVEAAPEPPAVEETPVADAVPVVETEAGADAPSEPEPEAAPEQDASTIPEPEPAAVEPAMSVKDFAIIESEFGAEIAVSTFKAGGGYRDAETAFYRKLRDENAQLKADLAALRESLAAKGGGTPADFGATDEAKSKPLTLAEAMAKGVKSRIK